MNVLIPLPDILALAWFILAWLGYTRFAEKRSRDALSLISVMGKYREMWMREMLKRDNRTMDSIMIGNLQRSISFFASTTIFILLGLVTMLGYREQARAVFETLPFTERASGLTWELKLFVLIMIFIYAFFKYTWSLRQYNYLGIVINAAPTNKEYDAQRLLYEEYAEKGAKLGSNAARHFNLGLRAYYFGLAVLGWFIHPLLFAAATAWVVWVIYRREFRSHTLNNLANSVLLQSDGLL